jgi:hypothetical protein
MKLALLLASIGMLAMGTSTSSLADDRESRSVGGMALLSVHDSAVNTLALDSRKRDEHADRDDDRDNRRDREQARRARTGDGVDRGMQAVPNTAGPDQPGHGWRYFSDPATSRAVVISPQGEYFFSRGKGLSLVAVTQPRS